LIIVGSAFATAHPVELLLFRSEIDTRLRAEKLREEAVRIARLPDAVMVAPSLDQGKTSRYEKERDKLNDRITAINEKLVRFKIQVEDRRREEERAKNKWKAAQRTYRRTKKKGTKREIEIARRTRRNRAAEKESAMQRFAQAQLVYKTLEKKLEDLKAQRQSIRAEIAKERLQKQSAQDDLLRQQEARFTREQQWLADVRNAPLSQPIDHPLRTFDPYQAGFVVRVLALYDLLAGRPPAWPPSKRGIREAASLLLGSSWEAADEHSHKRATQRAETFRRVYLIAFLVACVIPLLTLAFKLLLCRELQTYFSTTAQARTGNEHAVETLRAMESQASNSATP